MKLSPYILCECGEYRLKYEIHLHTIISSNCGHPIKWNCICGFKMCIQCFIWNEYCPICDIWWNMNGVLQDKLFPFSNMTYYSLFKIRDIQWQVLFPSHWSGYQRFLVSRIFYLYKGIGFQRLYEPNLIRLILSFLSFSNNIEKYRFFFYEVQRFLFIKNNQ